MSDSEKEEKSEKEKEKEQALIRLSPMALKKRATKAVKAERMKEQIYFIVNILKYLMFFCGFLIGLQFVNFFFFQKTDFYVCETRTPKGILKEYIRFKPSFVSLTGQCVIRAFLAERLKKVQVADTLNCEEKLISYKGKAFCRSKDFNEK